jgi:hypothetical protein
MRRRLAALAVVAFLGVGAANAHPSSASVVSPVAVAKTCGAGYVQAHLSWGVKCLRAGEFCKVGNREYIKYGFYCPATGHLRRR